MDDCFNPRARAGRDERGVRIGSLFGPFQSTRPCGARPIPVVDFNQTVKFQSTRPCGARLVDTMQTGMGARVSIHAPVRGAT